MNADDMYDGEVEEAAINLENWENELELYFDPRKRYERLSRKVNPTIENFLGKGPRCVEAYSTQHYYGQLLAWTVKCITTSPGWEAISHHGYSQANPVFRDIKIDYTTNESCLVDGMILVKKDGIRLVITVARVGFIEIEAGQEYHDLVKKIIKDVADFLKKHNFYRGKNISFHREISFLHPGEVDWNSVILDPVMKHEIRLNTIDFLKNCSRLAKYGIPPKRGIILASEPGLGKTMICKALISETNEITCIITSAYGIELEGYISELFALAQDLSPSILFIEDIDFIGQERHGLYRGSPLLISLLAEMDGIAERSAIVVVATSNCYEALDKALSERPSRFDRIFKITRPNAQLRAEMVEHIAEKIPLSGEIKEYIAKATNGMTPAQLQEVIYGMVNSRINMGKEEMQFTRSDVDVSIGWINIKKNGTMRWSPKTGQVVKIEFCS
ncbi:MAG: ATP-binding protein [Dehalococcoidia bacterium]